MTDVVRELISNLREDAEWAHANEWETPITLSDHLEAAAEMIESLCSELEKTQTLAEARLKRKNMYKERSERSLFEQERYRLDLEKEREMRQHADEVATLFMRENEKLKRERDAMYEILSDVRNCADCTHHNESSEDFPCRMCLCDTNTKIHWQWRGVQEK